MPCRAEGGRARRRNDASPRSAVTVAAAEAAASAPAAATASMSGPATLEVRLARKRGRDRCRPGVALSRLLRGDGRAADAGDGAQRRDFDSFDDVLRSSAGDRPCARHGRDAVVGTYRLHPPRRGERARRGSIPPPNTTSRKTLGLSRRDPGARAVLRRCERAQPRRPCSCCGAASPPMSSTTRLT